MTINEAMQIILTHLDAIEVKGRGNIQHIMAAMQMAQDVAAATQPRAESAAPAAEETKDEAPAE